MIVSRHINVEVGNSDDKSKIGIHIRVTSEFYQIYQEDDSTFLLSNCLYNAEGSKMIELSCFQIVYIMQKGRRW